MASLHKNNGPNWYAAFYGEEGTRCFKSTGTPDKRLAMQIALQFEATAKQARDGMLTIKRVRNTLSGIYASVHGEELPSEEVEVCAKQWLERKESELASTSYTDYKKTICDFLDFIGPRRAKPMDTISKTIVANWRDSLLKRVSSSTAKKKAKVLRAFFNDAIAEGRASENPVTGLKFKKNTGKKRNAFTQEQIIGLLAVASLEWRGLILLAYYTGLRLGDAVSLNWSDVDLERMEIIVTATKTQQEMNLPVANGLRDCLVSLPSYDRGGSVFPELAEAFSRGKSSTLSNQFSELMYQAGLAPKPTHAKRKGGRDVKRDTNKLSFHSLRHSFVSNLKMTGSGDSVAKELAGHSSDAVSRVYTHGDPETLRAAVNKLPKLSIPAEAKND